MVLQKEDVREITEYLFSDKKEREVKYEAVKKAKEEAIMSSGKNVELVEELLDLQDQIKREKGKIAHLVQQIEEHKGLTDLQYYQQYLSPVLQITILMNRRRK